MTSVSSVATKESPAQESWITFGRSTHSSSLLKPAIFFSLAGYKCSFTRSSVVYWKWTNSSWRVRSDARTMKALRCDSPLPVCREDPTTCFDIRWAIRGEDSWFIRKDVFFRSWTQRGPSGAWLASPAGWVEFICGGQAGVEWKKTVLILPQI